MGPLRAGYQGRRKSPAARGGNRRLRIANCELRCCWHGRSNNLLRGEASQRASEPHSILNFPSSFRNSHFANSPPPRSRKHLRRASGLHGSRFRGRGQPSNSTPRNQSGNITASERAIRRRPGYLDRAIEREFPGARLGFAACVNAGQGVARNSLSVQRPETGEAPVLCRMFL